MRRQSVRVLGRYIRLARRQIRLLQTRAKVKSGASGEELTYLLDAYLRMLQDSRLVRGAEKRIADDQVNAEAAVKAEIAAISEAFQSMDDSYIAARVDDIRGVGNRLLRNLTKTPVKPFSAAAPGSIVIADQLTPADTAQLDPDLIAGADLLVPVPLHWTRLFARRYNQAALLAHEIGKLSGLSVDATTLVRRRRTPSQGAMGRSARRRNVAGAFSISKRHTAKINGRKVLLIDDVMTTGATVSMCTKALLRAGAVSVDVLTLARVPAPAI